MERARLRKVRNFLARERIADESSLGLADFLDFLGFLISEKGRRKSETVEKMPLESAVSRMEMIEASEGEAIAVEGKGVREEEEEEEEA